MSTLQKARMATVGILLVGSVVMFLIAGNMVFAAGGMDLHVQLGRILTVVALALPVVAWLDRRRDLTPSLVIFVLFLMQSVTTQAAGPAPWLGAMHPLLGAALMIGLVHMMQSTRKPQRQLQA